MSAAKSRPSRSSISKNTTVQSQSSSSCQYGSMSCCRFIPSASLDLSFPEFLAETSDTHTPAMSQSGALYRLHRTTDYATVLFPLPGLSNDLEVRPPLVSPLKSCMGRSFTAVTTKTCTELHTKSSCPTSAVYHRAPTTQDKIFGKPSLDSGLAKSLRHCGEVSRLGAFRRENPSFAFFSTPLFKNVKDAIAHRYASPSFFGLAVRHEDHAGFPIQVLDAHPVKLSFVPHAGINTS
jgi:hypothetical protein